MRTRHYQGRRYTVLETHIRQIQYIDVSTAQRITLTFLQAVLDDEWFTAHFLYLSENGALFNGGYIKTSNSPYREGNITKYEIIDTIARHLLNNHIYNKYNLTTEIGHYLADLNQYVQNTRDHVHFKNTVFTQQLVLHKPADDRIAIGETRAYFLDTNFYHQPVRRCIDPDEEDMVFYAITEPKQYVDLKTPALIIHEQEAQIFRTIITTIKFTPFLGCVAFFCFRLITNSL